MALSLIYFEFRRLERLAGEVRNAHANYVGHWRGKRYIERAVAQRIAAAVHRSARGEHAQLVAGGGYAHALRSVAELIVFTSEPITSGKFHFYTVLSLYINRL